MKQDTFTAIKDAERALREVRKEARKAEKVDAAAWGVVHSMQLLAVNAGDVPEWKGSGHARKSLRALRRALYV